MHKRYVITCAVLLSPLIVLLGLNYRYLSRVGEFLQIAEIVTRQQGSKQVCLYGTALHDDTLWYKVEGYQAVKPQVAVVGSSVAMQFRERFFTRPFYSLSATTDSVVKMRHVTSLMLETRTPEVLFLAMDFWWFPEVVEPYQRARPIAPVQRFTLDKAFQPFAWIAEGKLSLTEFLRGTLANDHASTCDMGVQAQKNRRGFGPDGSYYYTSIITGTDLTEFEPKFAEDKRNIAQGKELLHDTNVNQRSINDMLGLIADLEAKGIAVIPFFQPLAPTVYRELQNNAVQYQYIPKLLEAFDRSGIRYFNFLDPATLETSDCEFVDGTHGGDVMYARLLRKIYEQSADPKIHSVINLGEIHATIAANAGFAMARDPRITTQPEIDFLQIGCRK